MRCQGGASVPSLKETRAPASRRSLSSGCLPEGGLVTSQSRMPPPAPQGCSEERSSTGRVPGMKAWAGSAGDTGAPRAGDAHRPARRDSAAWKGGPSLGLQGAWGGSGLQGGQLGHRTPGWVGTFLTSCPRPDTGCRKSRASCLQRRGRGRGREWTRGALESAGLPQSLSHCPSQAPPSPLAAGGSPLSRLCSPPGLALITRCVSQV